MQTISLRCWMPPSR